MNSVAVYKTQRFPLAEGELKLKLVPLGGIVTVHAANGMIGPLPGFGTADG